VIPFEHLAAAVSQEEREALLESQRELLDPPVIRQICSQVAQLIAVDLEAAEALSSTVRWLAARARDGVGQGLGARASANVLHSSGRSEQASALYEEALERFRSSGEALEEAITRSSALLNLAYLGRYETAFSWSELARGTFQRLEDRARLAILDHNLGNVLCRQDRWDEARERYRLSLEAFEDLGRHHNAAICLRNIAVCEINLHHFHKALAVYEKSRRYCREHGLSRVALQVDYNIAYLYFLRGEYTRAIQLYQDTRIRCREEGDTYHEALCDLDQAEIYLELNLPEEASRLANEAYAHFEALKRPYESGKALTFQALGWSRGGRGESALDLLAQARAIFEQEGNRLWPALIDFYQAVVLARENRPEPALRLVRQALEIFDHYSVASRAAMCELLLADLYLELGKWTEARGSCDGALERLRELDLPALEQQAFFQRGRLEEAAGRLDAAAEAYGTALEHLERLRSGLQGEDLKIAFSKDKQAVYESLVALAVRGRRGGSEEGTENSEDVARITFELMEKAKSRGLADLMAFRAQDLRGKEPEEEGFAQQARALREDLHWHYRQMDTVLMSLASETTAKAGGAQSTAQPESDPRVQEELRRLREGARGKEEELLRVQRELESADRELSSLQTGYLVALEALQANLGPGTALVDFFIARGTIFAAIVDRDSLEIEELGSQAKARGLHRLLQLQLSKMSLGDRLDPRSLPLVERATEHHLEALYGELIAPIRPHLEGCHHWVLAPHGFLHFVPFHALMAGGRPLIEAVSISYAPSGGVFHLCATKTSRWEDRSLVLGLPDERAPSILEEVEAVAEALPASTLLVGKEATADALRQAGTSRFVHIATHGLFRRDNPMFSAIQLGGSRLSLFDLYGLRLESELVVLSGCGTGLNAVLGADELVGLTRGLLYAGAQSALVTLWDVNDASTTTFMRSFYKHLGRGEQRAKALRQAMLSLRESHPNAYYWAPFILVGQPGIEEEVD